MDRIQPRAITVEEILETDRIDRNRVSKKDVQDVLDALHDVLMRGRLESNGARCPGCERTVKAYRRPFNRTMARFLIELTAKSQAAPDGEFFHISDFTGYRGGEYAYSRHWGLIESLVDHDVDTKSSGYWRPTRQGIRVAQNRTAIQSHVLLYNNEKIGFDGDWVNMRDVLSDPKAGEHNYSSLAVAVDLQKVDW